MSTKYAIVVFPGTWSERDWHAAIADVLGESAERVGAEPPGPECTQAAAAPDEDRHRQESASPQIVQNVTEVEPIELGFFPDYQVSD